MSYIACHDSILAVSSSLEVPNSFGSNDKERSRIPPGHKHSQAEGRPILDQSQTSRQFPLSYYHNLAFESFVQDLQRLLGGVFRISGAVRGLAPGSNRSGWYRVNQKAEGMNGDGRAWNELKKQIIQDQVAEKAKYAASGDRAVIFGALGCRFSELYPPVASCCPGRNRPLSVCAPCQ